MKLLWFGIAALIIIAAAFASCHAFNNIPEETAKQTGVYFCPADDCFSIIASLISSSSKADCAFYTLNSADIENALKAVNARLAADDKCPADIECKSKPSYQRGLMHNKFCVLDNAVITGSFNPNEKSKSYLNNVVVLYSKELAKAYADEFNELWEKEFGSGKKASHNKVMLNGNKIEAYFCPEDECQKRLLDELEKAEKSIYFMAYSFTDNEIANELLGKAKEGVIIRGFIESSQNSKWSVYDDLEKAGLDVKVYDKGVLHHKVFIIDNSTVITGSYNPTKNGNENNDENMAVMQDKAIAALFADEFNSLQDDAKRI